MIDHSQTVSSIRIKVKPNSPKNQIIEWDPSKGFMRLAIKAPAEKGKANKELVRFLSKKLKKKVEIIAGLKSREKVLKIY